MSEPLLAINGVYKIFKGTVDTVALDNVSSDIFQNEFVSIFGPSGSGKTTLLKCVGNIWKPTTGRIFYNKDDITLYQSKESSEYRINDIGFIFQEFNLIPSLTVSENIELPIHLSKKLDKKQRKERVISLLDQFGISRYENSMPDELSAGEQQRVAICVALANEPSIILADEPTANLDAENREIVLSHLKDLSKQDTTIIVASHDSEIKSYSDRILHIDKGKIQAS